MEINSTERNYHLQNNHWIFTYKQWGFDEKHYVDVIEYLNQNNIFSYVDLGANSGGVCSILLERISTLKKCYLFEPQKDNFEFMQNKFKSDSRVICYNFGILYSEEDYVELFRCDDNVGGYTAIKFNEDFISSGDKMEVKKLEDFDFGKIDFIKIDVEGAEENIILNSTYLQDIRL
jgi:FkbM family methyltransferase